MQPEENIRLIKKYPFLKINESSVDDEYVVTWLDFMPQGWKIAFGEELCEEILNSLQQNGIPVSKYEVLDVKEKYGVLCWYDNTILPSEGENILRKYQMLSGRTCGYCGEKATKISKGYIFPYCDSCFDKYSRCSKDDYVPVRTLYKEEK